MPTGGEAGHVGADLGEDHRGGGRAHSRDCVEAGDHASEGGQFLAEVGLDRRDWGMQVVDVAEHLGEQERVVASWLNQVEIYFSILQRKAINPNDFRELDDLAERILDFQDRYNAAATPFDWTYTRDDLNAFIQRLGNQAGMTPTNLRR